MLTQKVNCCGALPPLPLFDNMLKIHYFIFNSRIALSH